MQNIKINIESEYRVYLFIINKSAGRGCAAAGYPLFPFSFCYAACTGTCGDHPHKVKRDKNSGSVYNNSGQQEKAG